MKNLKIILLTLSLIVVLVPFGAAQEDLDPVKVGPDVYKLVFENEKVRVMEATFAPGASIGMHAHPDHFAYALSSGKLEIKEEGKEPGLAEAKAGDVFWMNAQTHAANNPGESEIKFLVVEIKEAPKAQ